MGRLRSGSVLSEFIICFHSISIVKCNIDNNPICLFRSRNFNRIALVWADSCSFYLTIGTIHCNFNFLHMNLSRTSIKKNRNIRGVMIFFFN